MKEIKYGEDYIVCPHCGEKSNSFLQWNTISVADKYNMSTNKFEMNYNQSGSELEAYGCIECGEDISLPDEVLDRIYK